MAKIHSNPPSANILMNSMRSMGYSFEAAIADIVDNSISANASIIWIDFPVSSQKEPYVTVLDNGTGMSFDELLNAMKYGSQKDSYSENDLGRFGLGLKAASLSQCRKLTVASKQGNNINCLQWNLDVVIKNQSWDCIELSGEEYSELPGISKLKELQSGTLVIWQDFDEISKEYGSSKPIFDVLSSYMDDAENHIRLVFHRFLNKRVKPLKILINNREIVGLDPFLESSYNPKNDLKKESEFSVQYGDGKKAIVKMQACILPHQNDLTKENIDALGGIENLKDGQGFYVYRNDRLIIYGTWFRLSSKHISPELYKYGRIKVDIPNSLDEIWRIDIKKQKAVIPPSILNLFRRAVSQVERTSEKKAKKRMRLSYAEDEDKIWAKELVRDGKESFYINPHSKFITSFLDTFDDKDKSKILRFLDVISSQLPFDDIYISVCEKKNTSEFPQETINSIVQLAIDQIKLLEKVQCISREKAIEFVTGYSPFDSTEVVKEIKRRLQ